MMLLYVLVAAALLLLLLGVRIAASPPFALLRRVFASWSDRCHGGGEIGR